MRTPTQHRLIAFQALGYLLAFAAGVVIGTVGAP
jgi:hypothetical protein